MLCCYFENILSPILELIGAIVTDNTEKFDLSKCVIGFGYCGNVVINKDVTSFTLLVTFETGASATGSVTSIGINVKAVVTSMTLDEDCG